MTASLVAFVVAAVFEIAGCYAFWAWMRRGATPLISILGVLSLMVFAIALTRVDSPFAGRAYAAYGGIYIAASLGWLWVIERQRPTTMDAIGAAVAIAGAVIILYQPGRP